MITVFEQELEKGTGVPYILLQNKCIQPSEIVEDIFYQNIIENKAFGPSFEGSRSDYVYDLLELYPERKKVDSRVIAYFNKMDSDDRGDEQVFNFAVRLAQDGRFEKNALYKKFEYYAKKKLPFYIIGIDELIKLDKYEAVVYLARYFGSHIEDKDIEEFAGYYFYNLCVQDYTGYDTETITAMLQEEHDPAIDRYLSIAQTKREHSPRKVQTYTADEVILTLQKPDFNERSELYRIIRWVDKQASDEDIKKLSACFIKADETLKKRLIRLFTINRCIQVPIQALFDSFDSIQDGKYRTNLVEALVLMRNPDVYDFLLERYDENTATGFLKICVQFYSEDREWKLLGLLDTCDMYDIEDIVVSVLESEELVKYDIFKYILRLLYHKTKCSICRGRVLEKMMEHGVADANIYREIQYDANKNIRELAEKSKAKKE
ncbi:hypothetical protein E4O00_04850 [Treponema sp. OMZ 788]|uniref:hypothetical protein n=1 Tax=Treponema sp. OMZ 788 TaxID=2563664 RepID=UPI0020A4CEA2|nr:hypothetical protein [Treponema sp. OMZ 788]UTC65449.1 hypothetical protein E4O00_04850 [Treponema sp. OMZ 788]